MDRSIEMLGAALAATALSLGCTPDAQSVGPPDTETSGATSDEGSTDTDAPNPSTGADSASAGTVACDDPDTQLLWAYDGELVPPMALGEATMLGIDVARSLMADMGTLTLQITTTCDGPLYLDALVWDFTGGNQSDDPDSFYVSIDGSAEEVWQYGCSTPDGTDQRWWWLPIELWTNTECDHLPLQLEVPAGDHTLVLRNRESGAGTNVAAIAAVVASHDPDVDPQMVAGLPQ